MVRIKKMIAGVAVAALAGGGVLLAATPAFAATTVDAPWEPDAQAVGTVTLYDASGNVVTSGNDLSNAFAYAAASNSGGAQQQGGTKAFISYALPSHTSTPPNFFNQSEGAATTYPNASYPAPLNGLTTPVNSTIGNGGSDLTIPDGSFTFDTTAGYDNIVQLRLFNSGGTATSTAHAYWDADIEINSAAGTWTQVYPYGTTTTVAATPNNQNVGSSVSLTATVTAATDSPDAATSTVPAGSVDFTDITGGGSVDLGSTAVNTTTGIATVPTTALPYGTRSIQAVFTPTNASGAAYQKSTGTTTETIIGAATTTTVTVPTAGLFGLQDVTITGTVKDASNAGVNAGSVSFYDNGSTTALGTVAGTTGGTYALDVPGGLPNGANVIVAKFTATDPSVYAPSQGSTASFILPVAPVGACVQVGSVCSDPQGIEGAVPIGTITITTPYNGVAGPAPTGITQGTTPNINNVPSTPGYDNGKLNIGTLKLNSADTMWSASTTFQDISVTDNLSANQTWTVSASSSDLTDGGTSAISSTIDSQNVGLTGVTGSGNFTGTVDTSANNPAASPAVAPGATGSLGLGGGLPHLVASATSGLGTYTMNGTITLNAPTTTEAGVFSGTITFTVVASS